MRIIQLTLVAAATTALTIGLSGCAGGQSVAEACKIVGDGALALQDTANDLMTKATDGDKEAVASGLEKLDTALADIGEKVTNAAVKPVWDGFATAYSKVTESVTAVADLDPTDTEAASAAVEDMTAATGGLQAAQTKLTEVCS